MGRETWLISDDIWILSPAVPFRDSVLTKLLKNALGGNSKTIMVRNLLVSFSKKCNCQLWFADVFVVVVIVSNSCKRTMYFFSLTVETLLVCNLCVSIGNSMICSDIWKLLYVISRANRRVKFETILKYHEWYLCQISRTNHAIICLYYYPQKVWNFHM